MLKAQHAIILFDGDCLFCNKSVRFIIKHDTDFHFKMATLNGKTGSLLKERYNIPKQLDSLVLIENDRYYDASTAALRISRNLNGIYRCAAVFLLIPKPIRDAIYDFIAERRHQLLSQHACVLPTDEERKHYLD